MTDLTELEKRLFGCKKLLIGLGEEWKLDKEGQRRELLHNAYRCLYQAVKDKDYFIITMATDAMIYDTPLGSRQETVMSSDSSQETVLSCKDVDEEMLKRMEKIFPEKPVRQDSRWERIVAPCGNETWRQCSRACTKDIWEPGEIPDDRCPHCKAPLIGNTREAQIYIEEGYLPQWERYTHWLGQTLNQDTLILELGAGFDSPGVIRFPFEKTAYFNQKAFLYRVNKRFPQIAGELKGRAAGVAEDSAEWLVNVVKSGHL